MESARPNRKETSHEGSEEAKGFQTKVTLKKNGATLSNATSQPLTLAPKAKHVYGPVNVSLGGKTDKVQASAFSDHGNRVKELNEINNACALAFTSYVVW